jgi:hypothetical protein
MACTCEYSYPCPECQAGISAANAEDNAQEAQKKVLKLEKRVDDLEERLKALENASRYSSCCCSDDK